LIRRSPRRESVIAVGSSQLTAYSFEGRAGGDCRLLAVSSLPSVSGVIGVARQDRKCTIDLLGQDQPRE
jgi:hypothetical protein